MKRRGGLELSLSELWPLSDDRAAIRALEAVAGVKCGKTPPGIYIIKINPK
ncbi:MAG: hypothetical protein HQK98_11105 [Nitrospirae bacterium]|nr:hypothetical protein [Nitrospirota bacterium]